MCLGENKPNVIKPGQTITSIGQRMLKYSSTSEPPLLSRRNARSSSNYILPFLSLYLRKLEIHFQFVSFARTILLQASYYLALNLYKT